VGLIVRENYQATGNPMQLLSGAVAQMRGTSPSALGVP